MPWCAFNTSAIMDDEDYLRLSVVDVYDIAADIGKEFEKIIDQYGTDVLTNLMPRVITALEQLERVAEKQEASGAVIEELRSTISVLENQKLGQAEHRQRYARDLEDIERDMREEKQELSAKVTQLLDENRKLSTCLQRSADNTPSVTDDESSLEPEVTRSVVTRLQDALETQRDQLHSLQQQLQHKLCDNDQLSSQVERLTQANKDLRRRSRQSTQQIRQLVEERAEMHVSLQEQQRSLDQLQQRLGLAAKENYDLATAATTSSLNDASDLSSKLVYDRNDPNRPRFTLIELKDILYQRNELKARLSDLEDELSVYRPSKQQRSSHIICPPEEANGPPLVNLDRLLLDDEECHLHTASGSRSLDQQLLDVTPPAAEEDERDPPVQGPMPYEPDDAPWKRGPRESGIRKFFQRMKKLSGVVLAGHEPVLGTPTTPHRHHNTCHQYHSTPTSALCTPTPSLNISSPPSLRSLPSQLDKHTPSRVQHTNETSGGSSKQPDRSDTSSNGCKVRLNVSRTEGSYSANTSNRYNEAGCSNSSSQRGRTSSGTFSFEKFRNSFGLSGNSSNSSQNESLSLRRSVSNKSGSSGRSSSVFLGPEYLNSGSSGATPDADDRRSPALGNRGGGARKHSSTVSVPPLMM